MKEATVPEKMASNGSGLVPYVASLLVGVVVGCGAYLFWLQSLDNAILLIGAVIVFAVSFTLLLLARNVRQTKIAEEQQKTKEAVKRYFLGFDEKRSVKTMPIISGVIFVLSLIFGANQLVVIICGSVFGGFLGQWIIVKVADLLKLDRKDQSVRFDLIFVAALLVIVIVVLVAVTQSVDPDIVRYREHPELLITEAPTLYAEMQTRFAPATQQPVLLPTVTLQPPAIMPPTALPTNTPVTQTPMPVSTQQCTVVAVENGVAQWNCISSS